MFKIDVRVDIQKAKRELDLDRRQVPYAASLAINEVLKKAQPAVQAEMRRVFDRPTPWTLNSYRVLRWAKKYELIGIVGFKDVDYGPGRGTVTNPKAGGPGGGPASAAGVYLQPQMEGGARVAKGLERLLRSRGILGAGEFLVPSRYQATDRYGNVSRGVVQKIIANLGASFDPYSRTPSGGARGGKKKADYFFTRRGIRGARLTAIWQNFGARGAQHAVPAFIVVASAPKYKKRFDMVAVVQREVDRHFPAAFEAGYARAVATAR